MVVGSGLEAIEGVGGGLEANAVGGVGLLAKDGAANESIASNIGGCEDTALGPD